MTHFDPTSSVSGPSRYFSSWKPPLPLFLIQPILRRIVNKIATENPDMFGRLGPHYNALFVIDPTNLPFVMLLRPDPNDLLLKACPRSSIPPNDAKISGSFMDLLMLVDGDLDGDALFFARDLTISGNTEAVVCLRNALDDIDGSIAGSVAEMFGPAGRAALNVIRRASNKQGSHT